MRRAIRGGRGLPSSLWGGNAGRARLRRSAMCKEIAWTPNVPSTAFIACHSGLTRQSFEAWLDQTAQLDCEAKAADAYAIASLIAAGILNARRTPHFRPLPAS